MSLPYIYNKYIIPTERIVFSLKNHNLDDEVIKMFDVGAETMNLPLEEKKKYDHSANGQSFG